MIVNLADACIVIGEIERENASLKERIAELEKSIDAMMSNQAVKDAKIFKLEQRIAELEHDLSLAAELTGEAQMRVSELEQQLLEANSGMAYKSGVNAGMERAAVIASNVKAPFSRFTIAAKIRNEIEK